MSMLPYMDPEVAKKALEQFPAFADLARTIVTEYKVIVDTLIKDNASSQNSVYGSCNNILDSLRDELLRDDLTPEERDRIEDKMIEVAKILSEKDSENKKFLTKVMVIVGITVSAVTGAAAAILGSNTDVNSGYKEAA